MEPSPEEQQAKAQPRQRRLSRSPFTEALEALAISPRTAAEGGPGGWEPQPDSTIRRPFWVLRLIQATVLHGGYVTPRFHVPKVVWEQDGTKLSGLSAKISAFESVLALLVDRVKPLEPLGVDSELQAIRKVLAALTDVRLEFDQVQNNLSRPFPFIREVVEGGQEPEQIKSPSQGGGINVGRLGFMVSSIGKSVVKSAATAVERIGANLPGKVSEDELTVYASLVLEMCDKCQAVDEWYCRLSTLRRDLQQRQVAWGDRADGSPARRGAGSRTAMLVVEEALAQVMHIARFVQEVVSELLLRDLEALVENYLRRMRRCFARLDWDEDVTTDA